MSSQQPWKPEVELDDAQAAALIDAQMPSLAPAHLRRIGEGWDNTAYLVNDDWVFRFPRRQMGAELIAVETRVLPAIAPVLPVAVPRPEHMGAPEGDYPFPFAGYRRIPGTTACRAPLDDPARVALAAPLGSFLRALHAIEPAPALEVPGDRIRRADLRRNANRDLERLAEIEEELGPWARRIRESMTELAEEVPLEGPPRLLHGDLYARHLLVDDAGALAGIIDWGDLHLGDPALDLSIAWSFLPPPGRKLFCEAYGRIDDATWQRARFRALHYGIALWVYGRDIDDQAMLTTARRALECAT